MTEARVDRVPLSKSQQNIYNGVLQDGHPALYLVGKRYRFHRLELPAFLTALEAAILENPIQLCVLEAASPREADYPELVGRLQPDDIVRVRPDEDDIGDEFERSWSTGILAKPLVCHTVRADANGYVSGLEVHTHHILLDGGATGMIEADLARHLSAGGRAEIACVADGLIKLAEAHRREAARVEDSRQRLADVVQRELVDEARRGVSGQGSNDAPRTAAKGVLRESVQITGDAYESIAGLSDAQRIPLNVLVAAAAVAVDASLRQSTEGLLVHAVDSRFGDAELNVATCLVNSVAHAVHFSPFASVRDVVRALDRGYVKAVRRRWLREEYFRRIYMAVNRTSHVEALTLNFIREPCAPSLRPFLSEAPVATDVGPVEGMTVACLQDEDHRTLNVAIWDRADARESPVRVADRIAAVLESMAALWDNPIAMAVDEWIGVGPDGALCHANVPAQTERPAASAWFLDPTGGLGRILQGRRRLRSWVGWLMQHGAVPGDVVVLTDDDTDKTTDLLIASHLAGCAYSVCDTVEELDPRAEAIATHNVGASAHVVDVATARLAQILDEQSETLVDSRIDEVIRDPLLATKTAYIMPTSGSTGQPKLVRISHESLAVFCHAVRHAYGWAAHDTILQCAPLTSDISVEEIFGAAACGSTLVRSTAMRAGDLTALTEEIVDKAPTVVDLPTAVWHLLCEDDDAIDALRRSRLRQVVIGGEAIRPSAVDKWIDSGAAQKISLISTYGPTETTVVVTYLPIMGTAVDAGTRLRLGRPMVPDTVFIAFGEVVIVGDLVSSGYLGIQGPGFGTVTTPDGSQRRAFATADRVTADGGFPVFSGRKDAIVKVSGKRVDTAAITRQISGVAAVSDVAVELHDGRLGVWFESQRTREDIDDAVLAARIRLILVSSGVSSFFVVGVPNIPRKPNGKIDSDELRTMPQFVEVERNDAAACERAAGLAKIWSRHLGVAVGPGSSLLEEGIGSLDLIRILPDTRRYLSRHVTLLDLISADTAENLAEIGPAADAWMNAGTAAEIERDLAPLRQRRTAKALGIEIVPKSPRAQPIVVLGASGILGTGFAQAVLDLARSSALRSEVVLVTRSTLPEADPWTSLQHIEGVRIEHTSPEFGPDEVGRLIQRAGAHTVINCIGNTNVLVPYGQLRPANVELVSTIAETCASLGVSLVHLSTFVVNADVAAPRVTDPREAPYPYAASKSLAELVVTAAPDDLDFTIARLPRVLGNTRQMHVSADILVSVVDACAAMGAYPAVTLTEEVTTGRAVAQAILGRPESWGGAQLGRGITVVRGEAVPYAELLSEFARDELEPLEWKYRLDQSDWARQSPRRWSVVDGWVTLGMRLGKRSYAEYLADYPTIDVDVASVAELNTKPQSVRALLDQSYWRRLRDNSRSMAL